MQPRGRCANDLLRALRDIAIQAKQKAILAVIAVEPANKRSIALFKTSLGCREIGRHYDEERNIMWGLFKSIELQ